MDGRHPGPLSLREDGISFLPPTDSGPTDKQKTQPCRLFVIDGKCILRTTDLLYVKKEILFLSSVGGVLQLLFVGGRMVGILITFCVTCSR